LLLPGLPVASSPAWTTLRNSVADAHGAGPFSVGSPWLNFGWSRDEILNGVQLAVQSRAGEPPGTSKYFEWAIARAHAELTRAPIAALRLLPDSYSYKTSSASQRSIIN
jgi:hypothetical protein